ncbi:MAG: LysM peptidoglycan-binding domain-containing protein [Gaiellaceae bacterium]
MFGRVLILALAVLVLWGIAARGSGASGSGHVYVVSRGDTLWSIAERAYRGDPRHGVWLLQQRNDLGDGALAVGQRLIVPQG